MDNSNSINQNSRKYFKKNTKSLNCMQKWTMPRNIIYFGTEKLATHSLQISNLQRGKFPISYQLNPEFCNGYTAKRKSLALKQQRFNKNTDFFQHSQGHPFRYKKVHLDRFFITPNYSQKKLQKIVTKNFEYLAPYLIPPTAQNNNLFERFNVKKTFPMKRCDKSQQNVCLIDKHISDEPLLFECSAASLQLDLRNDKTSDTCEVNIPSSPKRKSANYTKGCNKKNGMILPLLHNVLNDIAVYRVIGNLNCKDTMKENSEEKVCSSMSTCSSSSSTREYYLPAITGSTDTLHVADVLAKQRIFEIQKTWEEGISKKHKNTQSKHNSTTKDMHKANSSNARLNQGIVSLNDGVINNLERDVNKNSDNQIITLFKGNDALLPFFSFNNLCDLMIKNRSRPFMSHDGGYTPGVQTKRRKIHSKHVEDDYPMGPVKNNKIIKDTKETSKLKNESILARFESSCKKSSKSLPLVTSPSSIKLSLQLGVNDENLEISTKECIYQSWIKDKDIILGSKFNPNCKVSTMKNISEFNTKSKSRSNVHVTKGANKELKVSSQSANKNHEYLVSQSNNKSTTSISNDSFNLPKNKFIKLNPLFDADFKDPKISRLIIPSKILAGESEFMLDEKNKYADMKDFTKKKSEEIIKPSLDNLTDKCKLFEANTMSEMTKESLNNAEDESEMNKGSSSNKAIVFTNSIIYGNNAFQKIKEKFGQIKNETQNTCIQNQLYKKHESMSRDEGIIQRQLRKERSENNIRDKNVHQLINNEKIMNTRDNSEIKAKMKILENRSNSEIKENKKIVETRSNSNRLKNVDMESSASLRHLSYDVRYSQQNTKCYLIPHAKSASKNHTLLSSLEKHNLINESTIINFSNIPRTIEDEKSNLLSNKSNDSIMTLKFKSSSSRNVKQNLAEKSIQVNMCMTDTAPKQEVGILTNITENEYSVSEEKPTEICRKMEKGKILNSDGKPIILFNTSGYPLTDLKGRCLKNNLGAYLLNTLRYEEIIKNKLPVFDCDHISINSSYFNPTKIPLVKTQLRITDRSGNPISLFNNLGLPLTDEDGSFLHDNRGHLLVNMDNYDFPLSCTNGSPIYLQTGAMLLSQKFKFIVRKPNSMNLIKFKKSENELVSTSDDTDKNMKNLTSITEYNTQSLITPKSKVMLSSNFERNHEKNPFLEQHGHSATDFPGLFDKQKNISTSRVNHCESIPKSPIPIFDLEGKRLTDENGYPLQNRYGEYMLLLDKNGFAISDSCGGPIFDSEGKQLLLKDMYKMYNYPLFNYSYDRFMLPEHPYIDQSTNIHNQITFDSSEEEVPLLDLKFDNHQNSEPIMNYIKANNIKAYNVDVKEVHWIKNGYRKPRKTKSSNIVSSYLRPINEKHRTPITSIKEEVLFHHTNNYQEEPEYENFYEIYNEEQYDHYIPHSCEQYVYENQSSDMENLYVYGNNYVYHDNGISGRRLLKDSNIQSFNEENYYFVQY